jgi:aryl-alcohol dehydrogenase-like predicted oxidoreductase
LIDHISKLSIGTAQIGQAYGLNAAQNNIDINEASKIIALCREIGINNIDTAYSYGHSERILGNVGIGGFNVNSKFSIEDIERQNIHEDKLVDLIEESLRRLKISKLDSLLLHNSKDLFGKNKKIILSVLNKLKDRDLISKFGISVYSPSELLKCLDLCEPDIIQAPLNYFDKRFLNKEIIHRLKSNKIELHVRSIFLQGLLLINGNEIPERFSRWSSELHIWHNFLLENNLRALDACLYFALNQKMASKVVFGIDSLIHLTEISESLSRIQELKIDFPDYPSFQKELIDPRVWPDE